MHCRASTKAIKHEHSNMNTNHSTQCLSRQIHSCWFCSPTTAIHTHSITRMLQEKKKKKKKKVAENSPNLLERAHNMHIGSLFQFRADLTVMVKNSCQFYAQDGHNKVIGLKCKTFEHYDI